MVEVGHRARIGQHTAYRPRPGLHTWYEKTIPRDMEVNKARIPADAFYVCSRRAQSIYEGLIQAQREITKSIDRTLELHWILANVDSAASKARVSSSPSSSSSS